MTKDEVLEHLCETVTQVYLAIDDFSGPSDGFCRKCPGGQPNGDWDFRHEGHTLDYVREAVEEKLARDGYELSFPWATFTPTKQPKCN